ncbi:MAG: hypothetical protein GY788_17270 [bacterium]|nr:hypothetical protein [bacterium]
MTARQAEVGSPLLGLRVWTLSNGEFISSLGEGLPADTPLSDVTLSRPAWATSTNTGTAVDLDALADTISYPLRRLVHRPHRFGEPERVSADTLAAFITRWGSPVPSTPVNAGERVCVLRSSSIDVIASESGFTIGSADYVCLFKPLTSALEDEYRTKRALLEEMNTCAEKLESRGVARDAFDCDYAPHNLLHAQMWLSAVEPSDQIGR